MTDQTSLRILVTGGAGFIGSALVRHLIRETGDPHQTASARRLDGIGRRWPMPV